MDGRELLSFPFLFGLAAFPPAAWPFFRGGIRCRKERLRKSVCFLRKEAFFSFPNVMRRQSILAKSFRKGKSLKRDFWGRSGRKKSSTVTGFMPDRSSSIPSSSFPHLDQPVCRNSRTGWFFVPEKPVRKEPGKIELFAKQAFCGTERGGSFLRLRFSYGLELLPEGAYFPRGVPAVPRRVSTERGISPSSKDGLSVSLSGGRCRRVLYD